MSHNEQILEGLKRAFAEERLHHAYILSGPAAPVKVECVERFAASLFAGAGGGLFGGGGAADEEAVLARIRARNHPDFLRLEAPPEDADKDAKTVLEQVRELPRALSYPPLEGPRRVILIPDAGALNDSVYNSVLKILEEPPAHTMFFLLCRDPGELLQTIRSRCQTLRFAPLADAELLRHLGDRAGIEEQSLLSFSEGALERAELLLGDENRVALRREACERLLELWEASPRIPSAAAQFVEKLEDGAPAEVVVDSWLLLLRDFAFVAAGAAPASLRFRDLHARLAELARRGGERALREIPERASALNRFRVYRDLNGNLRLDLSALLTELQIFSVGKGAGSALK